MKRSGTAQNKENLRIIRELFVPLVAIKPPLSVS